MTARRQLRHQAESELMMNARGGIKSARLFIDRKLLRTKAI
jgi:hypothetical protein